MTNREIPFEQDWGNQNEPSAESDGNFEAKQKLYKEAPGLYKEWGMTIVNDVIVKLEKEYPRLKKLNYVYKHAWVADVVVILVQQTEDPAHPITEEQIKMARNRLMAFVEKRIRKYFQGEQALDELLWEQELNNTEQGIKKFFRKRNIN